jgi:ABC-2 type transport system permease protein
MNTLQQRLRLLAEMTRALFLAEEKNSLLGVLWHLFNPLITTLVVYKVFSGFPGFSEIPYYPLFILLGVIQFNFFVNGTTRAAQGFIHSRQLILDVGTPHEILVIRWVLVEAVTYGVEIILLLGLIRWLGPGLSVGALGYLAVILGLLLLTTGVALLLAVLAAFLTDVVYIWTVLTRVLFFATPIFYDPSMSSLGNVASLIQLNPLTHLTAYGRSTLLGIEASALPVFLGAFLLPLGVLILAWLVFRSLSPRAPDFI